MNDLDKLSSYLGVAFLIATFCSVLAYAATTSYVAWRQIDGLSARDVAEHTFFLTAALAIIGMFLYLALER